MTKTVETINTLIDYLKFLQYIALIIYYYLDNVLNLYWSLS